MRPNPSLGRFCKHCSQHELRPVYHEAKQECSRSLAWADTVRHGGRIPEPSGPQQVTKKEMEKLEPTVRTCKKYKNSGCGETKYFSGRVCPSCVEKKAQLKQDKSSKKQERVIAQAAKKAAKKGRQPGRQPGKGSSRKSSSSSSSSSSGSTATCDLAFQSGASDKAHSSRAVAPGLSASNRRPLRAAVTNALVRAEVQRALSGPSPECSEAESESESESESSETSNSRPSSDCSSESSSSDSDNPLRQYCGR